MIVKEVVAINQNSLCSHMSMYLKHIQFVYIVPQLTLVYGRHFLAVFDIMCNPIRVSADNWGASSWCECLENPY
jgi:hypothetical protein